MGVIVTYDENFAAPFSEIKLASGEHILLSLERNRLVVKALAGAERTERILYECGEETVGVICDGLIEAQRAPHAAPVRLLVSAIMNVPDTKALASALSAAAG
jgi:hypothetical protein